MNPHDEATMFAYVDGELDAAERASFEAVMANDASLAMRVDAQRQLRRQLADAFDPALLEPVPARLRDAVNADSLADAKIVQLPLSSRQPRSLRPAASIGFAMAASVVLGVLIGHRMASTSGALVVADAHGAVARAALVEALDTRLASTSRREDDPVHIGITYLAQSGEYCRTFAIERASAIDAGIACHTKASEWRIALLESTVGVPEEAGAVRRASSTTLPDSVRRAVEATIVGDALDAAAEQAARVAGWQPRRADEARPGKSVAPASPTTTHVGGD